MKENNVEVKKKKSNTGLIIMIVVLTIAVLGLTGYICYDKLIVDKEEAKEINTDKKDDKTQTTKEETTKEETKKEETTKEDKSAVETRKCIGIYSGRGAVLQDAQTGENTYGTITLELKEDGTYKLTKEGMDQYWTGHYTIIENALLLKEGPHTCGGPDSDCREKYSSFLNILDDCSKITDGYGPVFFNSNFELTK